MEHVLLTGANGGIGLAATRLLADKGYFVHAGVRADASGLTGIEGVRPIRLDVTDPDSIAAAVAEISGETDRLRAVVNNAGIIVQGPMEAIPAPELRRQFEVNVFGPAQVIRATLPLLRAGNGRVVNVSAPTAALPVPFMGPIGASKAALESLSTALRGELRPWNIPVVVVVPGAMDTPIFTKAAQTPLDSSAELYGPELAALTRSFEKTKLGAPEIVAAQIFRAVAATRPRLRYLAGSDAKTFAAVAHLPARLRAKAVASALGLAGAR